jgi:hypothetical protein
MKNMENECFGSPEVPYTATVAQTAHKNINICHIKIQIDIITSHSYIKIIENLYINLTKEKSKGNYPNVLRNLVHKKTETTSSKVLLFSHVFSYILLINYTKHELIDNKNNIEKEY